MKMAVLHMIVAAACWAGEPGGAGVDAGWPAGPGVFELADVVGVASGEMVLAFDRRTGDAVHLIHRPSVQEFVCRQSNPLFTITLVDPAVAAATTVRVDRPQYGSIPASSGGEAETSIEARAFGRVSVEKSGDRVLRLIFSDHPQVDLTVEVTAELDGEGVIRLGLRVRNRTKLAVRRILFPQMALAPVLGADASDDRLLVPWDDGQLISRPGMMDAFREADYPGLASVQFAAYYDRAAGIYLAAEDGGGYPKRWQRKSAAKRQLEVNLLHLFEENAGAEAAIPYDVVLRTFKGDWRDAAAIYKRWAVGQPWCARKLADRTEVPVFLKEGAGVIVKAGFLDAELTAREFGKDLERLPEYVEAYRRKTGLAHVVLVPYGWENRGTWAGIHYFPARPSDEAWAKVAAGLDKSGNRLMLLTSGYWWVVKRQATGNGPAFDDSPEIDRLRDTLIKTPDGQPWSWDCYNITQGPGPIWRGLSMHLCHGSRSAEETMKEIFLRAAGLGAAIVSFDQEQGAAQHAPCYDRSHGHGPGFGSYIWTGFRRTCEMILAEGKAINPELGLCLEDTSEPGIPYMATYWSRQFRGGFEEDGPPGHGLPNSVGLFSYLYHEYTTAIGAACVQGQGDRNVRPPADLRCFILSNNLCRGLVPGPFVNDVPLKPTDEWHRMVSRAFFSYCQPYARFPEYLVLGETVRPPTVACAKVDCPLGAASASKPASRGGTSAGQRPAVRFPAVNVGSFKAADGSVGTVLANTTGEEQSATVNIPWPARRVVLYDATRRELKRWPGGNAKEGIQVTLEAFGTRMLVVN